MQLVPRRTGLPGLEQADHANGELGRGLVVAAAAAGKRGNGEEQGSAAPPRTIRR